MSGEDGADENPDLGSFLRDHPLAYAAYRIDYLLEHNQDISESDEIPYIMSTVFPIVLVGYIVLSRARAVAKWLLGRESRPSLGPDGHLFIMSSQSGYRTQAFLDVAGKLQERDHKVLLLCSPKAESQTQEWEREGFTTASHRSLHGQISLWRMLRNALWAVVIVFRLRKKTGVPLNRLSLCYNFLLLETVKHESLKQLIEGSPKIHTFSPMPYLIASSPPEQTFVYQHGLQQPISGKIMAAPFFTPLIYLLWGEPWRDLFKECGHTDSQLHIVGSPWHDKLAEKGADRGSNSYDVLFVSGSHAAVDSAIEDEFEQLVANVVDYCEREGRSLAVKLHPLESPSWFEEHGWGEYVTEFDDIDDALLASRVSVTNGSTAFIESATIGVPAIVADLWEYDLDTLAPMRHVTFTNGPEVERAIEAALTDPQGNEDLRLPVRLGNATERIVDIVSING